MEPQAKAGYFVWIMSILFSQWFIAIQRCMFEPYFLQLRRRMRSRSGYGRCFVLRCVCVCFNLCQFLYVLYGQLFYLVSWLNVDITRALQTPSAASSSDLSRPLWHSCLVEENVSALPSAPGHPDLYKYKHSHVWRVTKGKHHLYIYLYASKLSIPLTFTSVFFCLLAKTLVKI